MYRMFDRAAAFNNGGQPLAWSDTSKVTTMASMFKNAVAFNQNIASWNANISSSQCTDFAAGATTWPPWPLPAGRRVSTRLFFLLVMFYTFSYETYYVRTYVRTYFSPAIHLAASVA
mmetsp:Transcript_14225/g.40595  ORF Transcript_14225/g.40595 Transcript_14225/m.40595 type:complete len:117 (-) Transcript_14225:1236-1586(-)